MIVFCVQTKDKKNVIFLFISPLLFQIIARIVDGSKFDEFKAFYGDTLVTGESDDVYGFLPNVPVFLMVAAWVLVVTQQGSPGYSAIQSESLETTESCFQSRRRR